MPINYYTALLFSFSTTVAFAVLLQAPRKTLPISGVIGAVGWVVFLYVRKEMGASSFYANISATLVLALLSELAARIFKQPATIFVIPGIFPIVPGLGMYNGMAKLIENNYEEGVNTLLTAGLDAAAIALGIMFMGSIFRVIKISSEKERLRKIIGVRAKLQNKS